VPLPPNPNFWRERVHPDDLPRIEAEMNGLFERGHQAIEYPVGARDKISPCSDRD
jgi:hypothetical protein